MIVEQLLKSACLEHNYGMFNRAIAADCRPCRSLCALPIRLRQLVNEVIALCTDTLRSARVYQQCNSYRHATGMHTECDGVSTYYICSAVSYNAQPLSRTIYSGPSYLQV